MTERYPEGMYSYSNERDWTLDPPDPSECKPIEDIIDSINSDEDYYNQINVYTLDGYTKVCELYSADDLSKFAGDLVATWNWHDATINIYLAYYSPSHIKSSQAITADVWDEISQVDQEFTSENTSINSNKLPAIFKMIKLPEGSINLDFGGGRFDNVAEYLEPLGVINLVYDPYNRSAEHNQEVVKTLKDAGGADSATCSNVLNVIKEPEARLNVLQNISKMVKPGGDVYITVYEGTGKGNEGATKSGYQLNRKTADYLEEIQQVFPNAERKGKLIVATN